MMFMAGDFAIHSALEENVDGILSCLAAAFEPYRAEYTPQAFADTVLNERTIHVRMSQMRVAVAVKMPASIHKEGFTDEVVGTIAWQALGADPPDPEFEPAAHAAYSQPREGHIRGMAVLPGFHGQGIADLLLQAADQALVRESCTYITLDTTIPLKRAQRFHERHGYGPSGQTRDFYGKTLIELAKEF